MTNPEHDKIYVPDLVLKTYEKVTEISINLSAMDQKLNDHISINIVSEKETSKRLDDYSKRIRSLEIKYWGLIGGFIAGVLTTIGVFFGIIKK